MSLPLLKTKLFAPPVRPDMVSRPRLLAQIEMGLQRKLTLVAAPAGYGKTTLMTEGSHRSHMPVGWLALDEGDSDPSRFWTCFIAALQNVQAKMGESALVLLQPSQQSLDEPFLTTLVNEMNEWDEHEVLVPDDHQTLATQPVHDGLDFMLNRVPSHVHLAGC